MAIRLGGVAALAEMARSQPQAHHLRVMEIFAAFLAYPPRQRGSDNTEEIDFHSADTVKIVDAINNRTPEHQRVEKLSSFDLAVMLEDTPFPIQSGRIEFPPWRDVLGRNTRPSPPSL